MRPQRPRQLDYSKPLIKIDNLDAFVTLENTVEGNKVLEIIHAAEQREKIRKIPVPINESEKKPGDKIVSSINGEAEKLGVSLQQSQPGKIKHDSIDYIRVFSSQNLPRNDIYEATYEDIQFLSTQLNKKIKQNEIGSTSTSKLETSLFEQIILAWELESDKVEIIDFEKAKQRAEEKCENSNMIVNFVQELYDYWKKQREVLGRPLIRKHLKPAANDSNPYIAFRPREKEKIKTRRNIRNNDHENIDKFKQLKQELVNCKYMIECIKSRENLKADIWEATSILKFEQARYEKDEKGKIDNLLVKQFQDRSKKHLEELKKLQRKENLQAFKFEEPIFPNEIISSQQPQNDLNYDLVCFLSSLIIEAEANQINSAYLDQLIGKQQTESLDTIIKIPQLLNNISTQLPTHPIPQQVIQKQINDEKNEVLLPLKYQPLPKHWHQKKQNCLKFKLCKRLNRCRQLLIDRHFKVDSSYPYKRIPQKYELNASSEKQFLLNQKWKRFSTIYQHSDSTEDEFNETVKSIKKNIAIGFKSFLKSKNKAMNKNQF